MLGSGKRPDFAHPLVRTVLYEDIPPPDRLIEHGRAARALQAAGARPDHVAAQLVLAAPIGESWAAETLAAAAAAAARRGAPEIASRFLERLLVEVDEDRRFEVLLTLGRVQALAGHGESLSRLRQAMAVARTPAERVRAAVSLGRVLRYAGAGSEAVDLVETAAADLDDPRSELSELAERELLATGTVSYGARQRLASRLQRWVASATRPPTGFFDQLACAAQAVELISSGHRASEAVTLAGMAIERDPGAGHLGRHLRLLAAYALMLSDRYERVDGLMRELGGSRRRAAGRR